MLLLGIDVGTTGAKAAVFDEGGRMKGYGFAEYGIVCEKSGWAEQDAEQVWQLTKKVIRQATRESGGEICALSLSVQGDAVIPIDRRRTALAPAQLGMDYRGVQEAQICEKLFGARQLFEKTGMRSHPLNSLSKILWIKRNDPALYERTYKFVTYSDFILAKLGSDEIVIDLTMASRTMAFHLGTRQWDGAILSELDLDGRKFACPVTSGTPVGTLSAALAEELGIQAGCVLVAGGHDQTCAALGAGVVREGLALDSHGTAEVISTAFSRPRLDEIMFESYYPCYLHVVPEMYFTFSLNHVGGILLKWYVDNFCHEDAAIAAQTGERLYEQAIKTAPDGPSSVLVLPHFNGSGTPTCDLNSKGAILGLTMSTRRSDIAKGIVDALSYELRINMETMRQAGIEISHLRCVGGGARSPVGLQSKADITGLPVSTLKTREAACLGASLLAGAAAGIYGSLQEAAEIAQLDMTYEPRPHFSALYSEKFCIYREIYDKIKSISYRI